ncbi:Mpv17 / PMP22 family [Geosmithia morbida]|uniref:Mpv17 / PMP22 family n=1 Tax=Geosmithia morbida TaxID=1094350 RepID=A0A9P4YSE4_9HYPO|nr:Mpv17 / PMP22 family [Geosmithia morbida]KAF4122256.1 Mpv17 / PMP22 family [Geosmithia morbida]
MTWELTRRRMMRNINERFIFGRIPLLHAIVLFIEMALAARLSTKFNAYYDERPIMTMMVTNALLGGIADTVAQTISAFRVRTSSLKDGSLAKRGDDISIEIADLDRKTATSEYLSSYLNRPPPFDFERLTRFMTYGFCMAPIQFKWFGFLERIFPITKTSALGPAIKRVTFDQFIFAPCSLAFFFTVMTVAEGGGRRAVANKLRDMYVPTLKANYIVWPAVQIVNFRLIPIPLQLPFVSTIGIAWTAYLSLATSSD